ncbi:DUF6493 family protein [Streptomyces sp. NBC_00094]|uniref:DUF7825 domain-containing protein n=1 Tax=Streptomyces sp. NBC_00094 TaxID=2903620 RepID=UPI002254785E|nr:DUF6493 family protein [Streptomyces sp. NBC_00094]MCX5389318.1 DUF6493 family protein [Streptomyces sp. NBC_00094]
MGTTKVEGEGQSVGIEKLIEAVRGGRADDVPALLEGLGAAERSTAVAKLKSLRTEVRGWETKRPREAADAQRALYVAGAGCHAGASAAATWLGGRDLVPWRSEGCGPALRAVSDRSPEWLADVAGRLAARPAVAEHSYELIRGMVERSGCAVPATDGYVLGWAWQFRAGSRWRLSFEGPELLERLREDPQTPVLVLHALSMAESPDQLTWTVTEAPHAHWPTAVATLVGEGLLDRAEVLGAAVSRLLRGGRPRDLRFPMEVLRLVEPTAEEFRERIPDLVGMTADTPSPIAGYAQEVLAGLAADGALPTAMLSEMTSAVLFRTEKKLVRAQLTLVGKALARDPGAAAELLPAVAEVFGNEDTELQGRALKLVGRHLAAVDASVRRELAGQAGLLSPQHHQAAAELFGDALETGPGAPYEEILPPVPEPQRVEPPAATVEELVEDMLTKGVSDDPVRFERALDGLVRHAHRDRAEVTRAVREAFTTKSWQEPYHFTYDFRGLHAVLAGLLGLLEPSWIEDRRAREPESTACFHEVLTGIVHARLWEAAALIGTDALPFLLASPTVSTGGIDPQVLVGRLRAYRDAGVEPAPADLAQALLRVLRTGPDVERAEEEASALGTVAGRRLAAWLRTDEPPAATVRFLAREEDRTLERWYVHQRVVVELADRAVVREEFPPAFRWLGGTLETAPRRCYHWISAEGHWTSILPSDREVLAALIVPSLARAGGSQDTTGPLTGLAEAEGRVGRAIALALALGMGYGDADDRLRAVDALLVLASRGDLDARQVGEELGWLVTEGVVKPNRLADAVRTAAATGAYATVWAVLGAALPGLLSAAPPVRGLGEVLAVAADCVERCGARGELPGLAGVASAKGSSQLVVQAKRLLAALG